MHLVPAALQGDSVVQIFSVSWRKGSISDFSFLLQGSKCSEEKEKAKKPAEACKVSLTAI